MDMTDEFDTRLKALQQFGVPAGEEEAAVLVYERLRTARAIARSLLDKPSNSDVLAVFAELASTCARAKTAERA